MSRALRLALAIVVAAAAVVGLLLFVQSREKSTFGEGETTEAPGRALPDQGAEHRRPDGFDYASDPPASGPHLPAAVRRDGVLTRDQLLHAVEQGNIVLQYGSAADEPALRGLQEEIAGPFDPALAEAGQAVLLDREPGRKGVVAVAWRHLLEVGSASDAGLRAFTDAYLGKGATG